MKKIIYIFLSRPVTTGMVLLSIIILGCASLFSIPIELTPEIEYPRISLSALWHGTSPEVVEARLTSKLESVLSTVKGLKKISSRSSEGTCYIDMEFHSSTDMNFARLEINEKLSSIKDDLPYGVSPPAISPYVPEDFRELQGFITFSISGNVNADEIRKYAVDHIKNQILAIDGVSDVRISGGNDRLISIILDYDKVKSSGITNEEITAAADEADIIFSTSSINQKNRRFALSISNDISGIEFIENLVVRKLSNGNAVRFRDIGKIINGYQEPGSYYRIDGKETVTIEISKEPGANTIRTADIIFAKMNMLQKDFPPGYQVSKEIDKSESIRNELNALYSNSAWSFLMILLVLLLIFRKIKFPVIVLLSIIFSVLFSIMLFYIFNISINILTLSSITLGFGLIVDNSILVIDYIDKKYSGQGLKKLAVIVHEIFFPVLGSTFTTIAVFIPLIFLTGELRLYFEQFAMATIFCLLSSLLVAFTFVPLAFLKFAYDPARLKPVRTKEYFLIIYTSLLNLMYEWKKISFGLLVLMIGLPVWLIPSRIESPVFGKVYNAIFDSETYSEIKDYINYSLGGSLNLFFNHVNKGEIWKDNETSFLFIRLELPNGNSIERINLLTKNIEQQILGYKKNYELMSARVINPELAIVRIDFSNAQSRTSFPHMLKNYLTAYALQLGGLTVSVAGFGPGFYNGLGTTSFSFRIKASGFNYEKLRTLAEQLRYHLAQNSRVTHIDIDKAAFSPNDDTYEIAAVIDRDKLSASNTQVNEIVNIIGSNTESNLSSKRFRFGNEEVNFEIKFSNYRNIQLNDLQNVIISNSQKNYLKLKDVISFDQRKTLSVINRENRRYVRYITFDYMGPYPYGESFCKSAIKNISIPEGYNLEPESFILMMNEEEQSDIWKTLIISALLVFMISASLFESFKKPFLVLSAIPFAFIGTIFLFYLGDFSFDRGAYAGLLLLVGLSVNNSIILIDYISRNFKLNSSIDIFQLSYDRLRPVFTTSITTIAALVPILLSSYDGFWKSLAKSITGGIVLSALIVILYIPLIYKLRHT